MNRIQRCLDHFRRGGMVVVFDGEHRENEADIIVSAQHVTPEDVSFIINQAKGLLCAAISEEIAQQKGFPLMPSNRSDLHGTAFTLSIDSRSTRTGISPNERCITARDLLNPALTLRDFTTPGHLFPLIARSGGLLERQGHTEAATCLCTWSDLPPAALICEMIRDEGSMFTEKEAEEFAKQHGLEFCTIAEMAEYQRRLESTVEKVSAAHLPTEHGVFEVSVYRERFTGLEHVFLSMGSNYQEGLVRMHSECLTGDILGSQLCDCGNQLQVALKQIAKAGCGALIYLRQEGRGIGLGEKIRAYALQQNEGLDTVDANVRLGHAPDERDYHQAAWILKMEGFSVVNLLTNNPEKTQALELHGLTVIPHAIEVPSNPANSKYLLTKKNRMNHLLKLEGITT